MIKRLAIMAVMLQVPLLPAFGETKKGTCQLKPVANAFDKDVVTVEVGEKIKGTCRFFIHDFLGKKIINAGIEIVNTADKPMYCQYYVVFTDEAGELIGCAAQGTFGDKGIAPGKSTQFGSCLIMLPQGFHEKAVRYQIAFYESDNEIGKEHASATDSQRMKTGPAPAASDPQAKQSGSGMATQVPSQPGSPAASTAARPARASWYSAGPGWKDLAAVLAIRQISIQTRNHGPKDYQAILSESQPGSIIVLLFALDKDYQKMPAEYADLLPMPWAKMDAAIKGGKTVEAAGQARGRNIVLLAAPTESQLKPLIHDTRFLRADPPKSEPVIRAAAPPAAAAKAQHQSWYCAGPCYRELNAILGLHNIGVSGGNHTAAHYEAMLSKSQPDATIVLLFALDSSDKDVPAEYADLLPKPWSEVEAALKKGETVEAAGQARERRVVLLAAPTKSKLAELIGTTEVLFPGK